MRVSDLRGILQYVPRFRDRIFVIAMDGEIASSENFSNILLDIAVLRSLSIKVVLVHGASYQIERLAAERGITLSNSDGSGITDEATLRISLDAAARLTVEIMQGLTSVDLRTVQANCVIAHPAGILKGVDHQFTGRVERVDEKSLHLFLNDGMIPVIPPFGFDGEGGTFRVNSDSIAVEVAESLKATKIIYMSACGIPTAENGNPISQLSFAEVEGLLKKQKSPHNARLHSKLEYAARASLAGVPRIHLLDGRVDEALLTELFSAGGIGTMVYSNDYQHIRRLLKKDVRQVMALIKQSMRDEALLHRTRVEIIAQIQDYWVLELDGDIVGCVALHPHPETNQAELACLYVSRNHENEGYGRKLITFILSNAKKQGIEEVFALSTQAFTYLKQKGGFEEATPDILPKSRRERYDHSARNSIVLRRDIASFNGLSLPVGK